MTLNSRERVMVGAAVAALAFLVWRLLPSNDPGTQVVAAADSIPMAERRLSRLRLVAAAVPGKQQILDQVSAELAEREKGVIRAATPQLAQAEMMQIVRRVGRAQSPPIDFKNVELGPVRAFGKQYGEATVSVAFDAAIEQLVNFMADLTAQKELISTNEVRIGQAHPKQKVMPVRLTFSAIVPKELVPVKKGPGAF